MPPVGQLQNEPFKLCIVAVPCVCVCVCVHVCVCPRLSLIFYHHMHVHHKIYVCTNGFAAKHKNLYNHVFGYKCFVQKLQHHLLASDAINYT